MCSFAIFFYPSFQCNMLYNWVLTPGITYFSKRNVLLLVRNRYYKLLVVAFGQKPTKNSNQSLFLWVMRSVSASVYQQLFSELHLRPLYGLDEAIDRDNSVNGLLRTQQYFSWTDYQMGMHNQLCGRYPKENCSILIMFSFG